MAPTPLVRIPQVVPCISNLENARLLSCHEIKAEGRKPTQALGLGVWQTWRCGSTLQPGCSRISASIWMLTHLGSSSMGTEVTDGGTPWGVLCSSARQKRLPGLVAGVFESDGDSGIG